MEREAVCASVCGALCPGETKAALINATNAIRFFMLAPLILPSAGNHHTTCEAGGSAGMALGCERLLGDLICIKQKTITTVGKKHHVKQASVKISI
jgi:hypothetical protein